MGALANPYVLAAVLAFSIGYLAVQKVEVIVKAAVHDVETAAKAAERGIVHVLTFGKK